MQVKIWHNHLCCYGSQHWGGGGGGGWFRGCWGKRTMWALRVIFVHDFGFLRTILELFLFNLRWMPRLLCCNPKSLNYTWFCLNYFWQGLSEYFKTCKCMRNSVIFLYWVKYDVKQWIIVYFDIIPKIVVILMVEGGEQGWRGTICTHSR